MNRRNFIKMLGLTAIGMSTASSAVANALSAQAFPVKTTYTPKEIWITVYSELEKMLYTEAHETAFPDYTVHFIDGTKSKEYTGMVEGLGKKTLWTDRNIIRAEEKGTQLATLRNTLHDKNKRNTLHDKSKSNIFMS